MRVIRAKTMESGSGRRRCGESGVFMEAVMDVDVGPFDADLDLDWEVFFEDDEDSEE